MNARAERAKFDLAVLPWGLACAAWLPLCFAPIVRVPALAIVWFCMAVVAVVSATVFAVMGALLGWHRSGLLKRAVLIVVAQVLCIVLLLGAGQLFMWWAGGMK